MKIVEKRALRRQLNNDLLIGICIGILGNAMYVWMTGVFHPLIIVGITFLILLWLIYGRKEDDMSSHSQFEMPALRKLRKNEIMKIRGTFLDKIKDNWAIEKGNISNPTKNIMQFELGDQLVPLVILRITFGEQKITFDYYENADETSYLIDAFIETVKEYPTSQDLFELKGVQNLPGSAIEVQGPVIYKE